MEKIVAKGMLFDHELPRNDSWSQMRKKMVYGVFSLALTKQNTFADAYTFLKF